MKQNPKETRKQKIINNNNDFVLVSCLFSHVIILLFIPHPLPPLLLQRLKRVNHQLFNKTEADIQLHLLLDLNLSTHIQICHPTILYSLILYLNCLHSPLTYQILNQTLLSLQSVTTQETDSVIGKYWNSRYLCCCHYGHGTEMLILRNTYTHTLFLFTHTHTYTRAHTLLSLLSRITVWCR